MDPLFKFRICDKQIQIPFVIYAHVDTLQIPETINKKLAYVLKPCGFSCSVKCSYDDSLSRYSYKELSADENYSKAIWAALEDELQRIISLMGKRKSTEFVEVKKEEIQTCFFCNIKLDEETSDVHHPITGVFLGVAHKPCEETRNTAPHFIPVIMHNMTRLGGHFLIKCAEQDLYKLDYKKSDLKLGIKRRCNGYELRVIDSTSFLLDTSIDDLIEDFNKHPLFGLKKEDLEEFDFVKTKVPFPVSFLDSFDKLSSDFPGKEAFFDRQLQQDISDEEYQKCLNVWLRFNCATLSDLLKIKSKSCVLKLQALFEFMRDSCMKNYNLDAVHYINLPSFAWDCMSKKTQVKPSAFDIEIHSYIKENIRGGIMLSSKNYVKANNKFCSFDDKKPETFIASFDCNNLAGWAMSQYLPLSDYKWLEETEIQTIEKEISNIKEDGDYGYIFEVALNYPEELQEKHKNLPFTFYDKSGRGNYVLDYRSLQQCLENGLILVKISHVLRYKQSPWLQPFASQNILLRTTAHTKFESEFYKAMNNYVFGKLQTNYYWHIPIGFAVVELSKKLIFDFHYKSMLQTFENVELCYIDTNSLIYEIQTSNFYDVLKSDPDFIQFFDTSNIAAKWNVPVVNKKVAGKMRDLYGGKIISEFCNLSFKKYCLLVENEEIKKNSGVEKFITKLLTFTNYLECLVTEKEQKGDFWIQRSWKHEVRLTKMNKTMLTADKKIKPEFTLL